MRRLLALMFLIQLGLLSPAQSIVWNWVPNQHQSGDFPDPIGNPVIGNPRSQPVVSFPVDMNGDGTVDFEFQAVGSSPSAIQVLPHGANGVVSISYPQPEIGQEAVLLNSSGIVSSLAPAGAEWLGRIDAFPYAIGSDLIAGIPNEYLTGQFIDQRGYVGVEFSAADGIHYGALDVAGSSELNLVGIIYGYGYNPVPGQPFNLSDIPSIPEPSTWALLVLGIFLFTFRFRKKAVERIKPLCFKLQLEP